MWRACRTVCCLRLRDRVQLCARIKPPPRSAGYHQHSASVTERRRFGRRHTDGRRTTAPTARRSLWTANRNIGHGRKNPVARLPLPSISKLGRISAGQVRLLCLCAGERKRSATASLVVKTLGLAAKTMTSRTVRAWPITEYFRQSIRRADSGFPGAYMSKVPFIDHYKQSVSIEGETLVLSGGVYRHRDLGVKRGRGYLLDHMTGD